MWSLGIGLRFSAENAKSIVWPALPGKSIVNRANTVSTVLIFPKPQLRCEQQPPSTSFTSGSTWRPSIFPAAAHFSNSSLIKKSHFCRHGFTMTLLNAVNEQNPRQIAAQILGQRRVNGEFTETLLERAFANAKLSALDRGLCQEIVYGVVRWQ